MEKSAKQLYVNFDEYLKSLDGEYSQEELNEMSEIAHEVMKKSDVDWREYVTYTRLETTHPLPLPLVPASSVKKPFKAVISM